MSKIRYANHAMIQNRVGYLLPSPNPKCTQINFSYSFINGQKNSSFPDSVNLIVPCALLQHLNLFKKLKQKSLEEYRIRHINVKDTYNICAILYLLHWSHLREVFHEERGSTP